MTRAFRNNLTFSRKQWEGISFDPGLGPDGRPQVREILCGGDYGGGKTLAAARIIAEGIFATPATPGYSPKTLLVSPTLTDVKEQQLVELRRVIPPELFYREYLYSPRDEIVFLNGHKLFLRSAISVARGANAGVTAAQVWVDEVNSSIYADILDVLRKRVRDGRANRLAFVCSGRSTKNHVQAWWAPHAPNRKVIQLFAEDNRHLPPGYSDGQAWAPRDEDGWILDSELIYPGWSPVRHLVDWSTLDYAHHPISWSIDLGMTGFAAAWMPLHNPSIVHDTPGEINCLVCVDQIPLQGLDAEQIAGSSEAGPGQLRDRGPEPGRRWVIAPGRSIIFIDPTAEPDQVRHFQRAFPQIRVVQVFAGFYHREENGERAVQRALRDVGGNARLYVHQRLTTTGGGRGIVEMFGGYRSSRRKDKKLEHAADTARYAAQYFLPLPNKPIISADDTLRLKGGLTAGLSVAELS